MEMSRRFRLVIETLVMRKLSPVLVVPHVSNFSKFLRSDVTRFASGSTFSWSLKAARIADILRLPPTIGLYEADSIVTKELSAGY